MRSRNLAISLSLCLWSTKTEASTRRVPSKDEHVARVSPESKRQKRRTESRNFLRNLDNTCLLQPNRLACLASSSACQWCEQDSACLAKGNGRHFHMNCTSGEVKNDHDNESAIYTELLDRDSQEDSLCASYDNCSSCSLSTHFCQWCAHDNACHEKGSIYGCVRGVDCYDDNRCKRDKPAPISTTRDEGSDLFPFTLVLMAAVVLLAWSATMFHCWKNPRIANKLAHKPDKDHWIDISGDDKVSNNRDSDNGNCSKKTGESLSWQHQSTSRIIRNCCYFLAIIGIAKLSFGPNPYPLTIPDYNICNDRIAWKAVMDTLAPMHTAADIEILASFANNNSFEMCIDSGSGYFQHGNTIVGTFDIPPTCFQTQTITDVLLVAHFSPEKGQMQSLLQEFFLGTLVLEVNGTGSIRTPSLQNATHQGTFDSLLVEVNEKSNRQYCLCSSWNPSNTSS